MKRWEIPTCGKIVIIFDRASNVLNLALPPTTSQQFNAGARFTLLARYTCAAIPGKEKLAVF